MGNPIDDNEALAKAVGRAVGHWALVEYAMNAVFKSVLSADSARAEIIWSHFRNVRSQIDIITDLTCLHLYFDENETVALLELLQRYQKLAGLRNKFVHNPFGWMSGDELAGQIYQVRKLKKLNAEMLLHGSEIITAEQINDFADESSRTYSDIWELLIASMVRKQPAQSLLGDL